MGWCADGTALFDSAQGARPSCGGAKRSAAVIGSALLATVLAAAGVSSPARAETKIRAGYLQSTNWLPVVLAEQKGYFKDEGVSVEETTLPGGPAIVSALVAKEIDIGYAAIIPPLNAAANGIPLKIFLGALYERQPDWASTFMVATKASGVAAPADLKGKTIVMNANGGGCELMYREHLAKAGLGWDDVKKVIIPFPQTQSTLEFGNADVACTTEPFNTAILSSPKLGAKIIAQNMLASVTTPVLAAGLFATAEWIDKNHDAASRFGRAYQRARHDITDHPEVGVALLTGTLGLAPDIAKKINLAPDSFDMTVTPAQIQPMIDAMAKVGLLKRQFPAADVVATLDY